MRKFKLFLGSLYCLSLLAGSSSYSAELNWLDPMPGEVIGNPPNVTAYKHPANPSKDAIIQAAGVNYSFKIDKKTFDSLIQGKDTTRFTSVDYISSIKNLISSKDAKFLDFIESKILGYIETIFSKSYETKTAVYILNNNRFVDINSNSYRIEYIGANIISPTDTSTSQVAVIDNANSKISANYARGNTTTESTTLGLNPMGDTNTNSDIISVTILNVYALYHYQTKLPIVSPVAVAVQPIINYKRFEFHNFRNGVNSIIGLLGINEAHTLQLLNQYIMYVYPLEMDRRLLAEFLGYKYSSSFQMPFFQLVRQFHDSPVFEYYNVGNNITIKGRTPAARSR